MKNARVAGPRLWPSACLLALVWSAQAASGQEPPAAPASDLADTGRKLSNPLSDVWALFSRFDLHFSEGDLNLGDPKVGSTMLFQPILPVPIYGRGADKWNLIARPTIPVVFSEPLPAGFDVFQRKAGLGDIELPTVIAPPTGNFSVVIELDDLLWTAGRPCRPAKGCSPCRPRMLRRIGESASGGSLGRLQNRIVSASSMLRRAVRLEDFMVQKLSYWISTALLAAILALAAFAYLTSQPAAIDNFAHLGYPQYFRFILGVAKALAAAALLAPGLTLVKEWAYAGLCFTWIGAFVSHSLAHDGKAPMPLVLLVLLVVSYVTRPAGRRRAPAGALVHQPTSP